MMVEKYIWLYSAAVEIQTEPPPNTSPEWIPEVIESEMIISSSDDLQTVTLECIATLVNKLEKFKTLDLKLTSLELLGVATDLNLIDPAEILKVME